MQIMRHELDESKRVLLKQSGVIKKAIIEFNFFSLFILSAFRHVAHRRKIKIKITEIPKDVTLIDNNDNNAVYN